MILSYDNYNRLKQSKLYLANPQKKYIGVLGGAKELEITINFNALSEASFKIYQYENGKENPLYNKLDEWRLVEIEYIAWFQIQTCKENNDGLVPYKEIKCLSLENELIGKKVYDISGVFALYDLSDQEHSLLHIIASESGWGIGHVDNELYSLYRTFSIDSSEVYNLLVTDISKSFDCVFDFNTFTREINVYKLDNVGELTDIFISHKNLLKEYVNESDADNIVTKLRVLGADDVDIRAVNPTSMNYIIDVSYYKVPISEGGWMTDSLVSALDVYQAAYDEKESTFGALMSSLQTLQSELTVLNAALTDLNSNKTAQDDVIGTTIQRYGGTPTVGSPEYTIYLNAVNLRDSYVIQIANKKVEITNKENEISVVQTQLDGISNDLDSSLYFTQEQFNELNRFLKETDDYQDSTFVESKTMTSEEVLQMKLELLANGKAELARISKPQYSFDITAKNLYTIQDNDRPISYSKWREKLSVGNLVTIQLREGLWKTVRVLSINLKFDSLDEMKLTLSDSSRFDKDNLDELLADAGRTSASLSLNKYGYDQASKITNEVRTFINGTLDASLNAIQSNANQDMYFDTFGLHMRKFLPDENRYDDCASWWTNNILLFTDDGWKTAKTGIGQFTTPSGEKIQAVFADVVCGQLIMGENLLISNTSGTYTINNNGFTATNGIYSVGINPNTPSEIINVKVNGVNKFYVDTANQKLIFSGDLSAASGTFSGTVSASTITGSTINGNTITGGTISGTTITGTNISGNTITGGTISGTTISGVSISAGLDANFRSVEVQGTSSLTTIYGGFVECDTLNSTTIGCNALTVTTLNNGTPITTYNKNSYTYNPSSHYQDSTTINPILTGGGNVGLSGINVASVNWVNANFEPLSASDMRLKKDIITLDIPDELFMELKPKQYSFKCSPYPNTITYGLLAQEVESAYENFGLNAFDYNIIDKMNTREYTDEGQYVDDFIHRINYENLHAVEILMIQRLYKRIQVLENKLNND